MIAFAAGYLFKSDLSDMLPFVWCGLVLVLYVLAFGRLLNLIDVLMPAVALSLVGVCVFVKDRNKFGQYIKSNIVSIPFLIYVVLVIAVPICVSHKVVTWWDDINYWASDLKSLYYIGGFARKYANVSPAFGDYPPGVQLAKWFVTHMDKHAFRENLAFAGYHLFNLSFLMPIFGRIKKTKLGYAMVLPLAIISWLFAGMAEIYGYAGFCADLSMAMLFGSILICIADDSSNQSELFGYIKVGLYLSVLVITKSTGAIWALFGILLWVLCKVVANINVTSVTKRIACICAVIFPPLLTGGSWMLFCLLRRRVTQTTSTMVTYITTDKYGLSEYTGQFAKAFIRAFIARPLHIGKSVINPSPIVVLVAIIILLLVMNRTKILAGTTGRILAIGIPVVGLLYYVVIFIAHITIFATETQYLEDTAMIASIERYGSPFMLGVMMLIAWLWMRSAIDLDGESIDRRFLVKIGILSLVVVLFSNIPAAYKGLIGYRNSLNEDVKIREEMIDDSSQLFLDTIRAPFSVGNARLCRVRDGGYYRVADTYVAYEASPASVISISFDLSDADYNTVVGAINQTHAEYVYVDKQDALAGGCLAECVSDGTLEYNQIYVIGYQDGGMVLTPSILR